jgi:1-acyl-sn-glycerol-3-phosphate acyltransferase
MFNPFKSIPAGLAVLSGMNNFTKQAPIFEKLRAEGKFEEERALILKGTSEFADKISRQIGIDFDIHGEENIPESGPLLIVANHQSYTDILAILYVIRKFQVGFIAKSEFTGFKPLAKAINYTRSIFIKRGDARAAIQTLNEAADLMKNGFSLVIFPEGTRSQSSEMGEFKPGSFKFAQKAKVPILPITLEGGYHFWEEKGSVNPCTIHVKVHPLVHFEEMDRKTQNQAHIQIEQTIRNGLQEFL